MKALHRKNAVIGETPNLAARMQGVANPGQIVVSDSTRRLLSNALDVEHIGQQDLKGISGPVDAYAILGETRGPLLLPKPGTSAASSSLVGRETEITMLMDRWNHAKENEGQVFVLSGEAGIGKSQISTSLINNLAGQPHRILQFQCSPYYASTALFPFIGYLEREAGFVRSDDDNQKLDKLETLLSGLFEDITPCRGPVCGAAFPSTGPAIRQSNWNR